MAKQKPRAMIGKVPVWCVHDKIVPCVELKPNPANPNTHPASQIELLGKIIREQGWRALITISKRSGLIVKGHARLEAAFKAGIQKAPVEYQDYESEAVEHADMVADNRLAELAVMDEELLAGLLSGLNDLDFDMELTGFSQDEIDAMLPGGGGEGLTDKDKVPEVPDDPVTKTGDLYLLGNHRLLCGDATKKEDVERLMDGAKADMVFTDPPYGVNYSGGIQYTKSGKKTNQRERLEGDHTTSIYLDSVPVMAKYCDGPIYIWFADTKALDVYMAIETVGEIHALIIWKKGGGYGALGANYKQAHEPCLYWKPKGKTLRWVGDSTECTVWDLQKDGKNEYHPTQKPVALAERAIGNHKARSVLDLFLGSGSTLIACEKTGRRCYGMEIDPVYCDVIVKRWEDFTGNTAELIRE